MPPTLHPLPRHHQRAFFRTSSGGTSLFKINTCGVVFVYDGAIVVVVGSLSLSLSLSLSMLSVYILVAVAVLAIVVFNVAAVAVVAAVVAHLIADAVLNTADIVVIVAVVFRRPLLHRVVFLDVVDAVVVFRIAASPHRRVTTSPHHREK